MELLERMGVKALVVDVDNTLMPYDKDEVPAPIKEWIEEAKKRFIVLSIANTRPYRAKIVKQELHIPAFSLSLKPLPFAWWRAKKKYHLEPATTVLIGDQLFTDALFAAFTGLKFIRVEPLSHKDALHTKFTRWLEKKLFS